MTRVRRTFWVLVAVAVLATGSLSRALTAPPGGATGLAVALTGLVAVVAAGLALRILAVTGRPRGPGDQPRPRGTRG